MIIHPNMILTKIHYKGKMYAIHKFYETKFVVLATTATHCQCLMPANTNHTFFVAEWIPLEMLTLVKPSQSDNFFSCKVEDVLETASEKLGQLHLK
jgi:hypothetical protein